MKQTAAEWLYSKWSEQATLYLEDLDQAKAMEREQMYKCSSFWRGKENEIERPIFDDYYKETFKSE